MQSIIAIYEKDFHIMSSVISTIATSMNGPGSWELCHRVMITTAVSYFHSQV